MRSSTSIDVPVAPPAGMTDGGLAMELLYTVLFIGLAVLVTAWRLEGWTDDAPVELFGTSPNGPDLRLLVAVETGRARPAAAARDSRAT